MRYLTREEIKTRLDLGKTVEQWLTPEYNFDEETNILTWLAIEKENSSTYVLRICQVYDEGGDSLNFYAFSSIDSDGLYREKEFKELDEAMIFIEKKLKIKPERFLNTGMCQEEYRNYLKNIADFRS